MAQEEQSQKCSNSSSCGGDGGSSNGRSFRKSKQKKVPQRGLGVAQLERIRLEEEQKKDSASSSTLLATKSSFLSVTPPNFHQSNQLSSSIPFPPPPFDLPSPNLLLRPPPLVHNIDASCSSTVPLPKSVWTSHSLMPRSQPFQDPCSMVNVSSATSSSSVLNFQMEPPSNQSYYSNYRPMWPDEEKMVGMKRPYPFSLDNPPGPFHFKLPTIAHHVSDESPSYGNGGAPNLEPGQPIVRESPSCSASIPQLNSKKRARHTTVCGGDFLTLGPPPATPTSKFKQPSSYPALPIHKLPDFGSLPFQGGAEDPTLYQSGPNVWIQQQPFYSFLPPGKAQNSQAPTTTTSIGHCNGEVEETIDLNLKL